MPTPVVEAAGVTASCAPGERLTSGAASPVVAAMVPLVAIAGVPTPNADGDTPTAWVATVTNGDMGGVAVVAFAVCVRAA